MSGNGSFNPWGMAMRFNRKTLNRLEKVASDFEADSSAELVFALARRSDGYPDVPYKVGTICALVALLLVVYLPFQFSAHWFWLDTVVAFGVGFLVGKAFPGLTRALTSGLRRNARVREAAEAVFVNRGVSLTRERTGVLVYISWLERTVILLWDVGIEKRVPRTVLQAAKKELERLNLFQNFPEAFEPALQPLKKLFDEKLPRPANDLNEISNRPVVIR
jgi:putative membrane protein